MAVDSTISSPLGPPACEKDAKALQFIEEMTKNADSVQERVLAEILSRNAETEYLRNFNLNGATDRDTYKSKIPFVNYEDLQPYIQRIANGDRSPILSSHPISEFLTSSGTSAGERKLMPTIAEEWDRRQKLYSLLMPLPVMNLEKTSMGASKSEVSHEVPPWIRLHKDGNIERLAGYEIAPAGLDHQTRVFSKDIIINPETGVSVRLYRPNHLADGQKLPLLLYFHDGAYLISSILDPAYHNSLNKLAAEAKVIVASVDFRRSPLNPLTAAFDDSWAALKWVGSHSSGGGSEAWVNDRVDFSRIFLVGDSAGASVAHHMAVRVGNPNEDIGLKLAGMILINPYFWGKVPIGSEVTDTGGKATVDNSWRCVCPSDRRNDDPLADRAPHLSGLACGRVLVTVAEKDTVRDGGVQYYEALAKSEWKEKVKLIEIKGEGHAFHISNPNGENATKLIKSLADFIHEK